MVVSAISACALAVAVAAAAAAGRSRDGSLVLLALGCLGVGFLMLTHGLVTPGIGGRPVNLWVGRLPVLAIATFAVCLAAAAWPGRPPATWAGRWPAGTLAASGLALTLVLLAISLWPAAGPCRVRPASALGWCWARPWCWSPSARCTGGAGGSGSTACSWRWWWRAC